MSPQRVLVVGAGPCGNILAYYLAKYGYHVMVVERSRVDQKLGQGIEIEQPALKVVEVMGVMDQLRARKTGEAGFELVDDRDRSYAVLGAGGIGITGELEMMRGDLTEILYQRADESPNVTYQYESSVASISQTPERVTVEIENRKTKTTKSEEFDFVVGADGIKSRTRQMIMGPAEQLKCYNSVNVRAAYFSIPMETRDWPNSRMCNFPGGRIVWIRPVGKDAKLVSVYLIYIGNDDAGLREANAGFDRQKQKEAYARIFGGLGWETERVLKHMMATDNFYSDDFMQVKLPKWSNNRVALVGDAAWAPTPITGEGNQLAILGAWVLAQEMGRTRTPECFEKYEKRFRAYVENAQAIPLGGYAQYAFGPQTSLGIWFLRTFMRVLAQVNKVVSWFNVAQSVPDGHGKFDLELDEEDRKLTS